MIDQTFCELLEYKITTVLQSSTDNDVNGYWCDGVLLPTFEHEYSQKYVNDNRQISLIAFIGADGQDKYTLKLLFGKTTLSKYARGLNISDCIPDFTENDAFKIDRDRRQLLIQLR